YSLELATIAPSWSYLHAIAPIASTNTTDSVGFPNDSRVRFADVCARPRPSASVGHDPPNDKRPLRAASWANGWPIVGHFGSLAANLPRSVLRNRASAPLSFSSRRIAE